MGDRELLELAAKAAGIALEWFEVPDDDPDCNAGWYCQIAETRCYWNPLSDDGAALRLAVALRISLDMLTHIVDAATGTVMCHEPWGDDHNAATRRAIVRAAAAMAA